MLGLRGVMRLLHTSVLVVGFSLCLSLVAVDARAQAGQADTAGSETATEAEYQQVVNAALNEYERGGWEEAAALFQRAHELRPSARTLRGLGLASYEARRYPESMRYLTSALSDQRRPLTAKQRDEVEATLARARLFVAYLQLAIEPKTAAVTINGQRAQADEHGVVITSIGWLEVSVTADGYEPVNKNIRVNTGEQQTLALRMTREGSEVTEAPTLTTRPETSAPVSAAAPLTPPSTDDTSEAHRTSGHALRTWKWVAAGGALAGIGVGATFLIMQKSQAGSYNTDCVYTASPADDCQDRQNLLGGTLWTGSIIGFSAGAALAALGISLFAIDGSARDEQTSTLRCGARGLLGASCLGHF